MLQSNRKRLGHHSNSQFLHNYEANQAQYELTQRLHKMSRDNLLRSLSLAKLSKSHEEDEEGEERDSNSLSSFRDEVHPQQIESFDSAKYRKNQLQRVRSRHSNMSANEKEKVFD